MNRTVINTFTGAMDKDIDKSLISNKSYLDAHNFRMVTTEGSSTGALETIKGNKLISVSTILSGQFIVGSCEIRDKIILFTTNNTSATPTAGRSMIYLLTVDLETEEQTGLTVLYDDSLNSDGSYLLFSTANQIRAVSRYESPNIQKVYFTDTFNNVRYVNVAANLTVSGEAYVGGSNPYMSADKFEFLPKFVASKPVLKDIVNGKVNTGVIAYAYQLYLANGAETSFSPLSNPIHVVSDSDYMINTNNYTGDKESINSGKGFIVTIDNTANEGYNRLRLIRVHYSTVNSIPEIHVVSEIEIDTAGTIIDVTDVGNNLTQLTIDEFNIQSTELFKCEDLIAKDNRLFAGNITKTEFTVDTWDARAIRFKSGSTATVYNSDDSSRTILADLSNWDNPSTGYPEDHDGINKFNDPDNDGNSAFQWMYQADGTTLGAEGKNIKIDFETTPVILDISNNDASFHAIAPTSSNDKSYQNYASPWKLGELSWQRDETYRLFIVFKNNRGQDSDPKWICDLRMPSLHDANFTNSSSQTVKPSALAEDTSGIIYTNRLYPRVYLKSFPTNAVSAQIYRVKRERADRSVVTQGYAVPIQYYGSLYCPTETYTVVQDNIELIKLVSPEINVTKNITKQGNDYIEYVTNFHTGYVQTDVDFEGSTNAYTFGHIDKMLSNTRVPFTTSTVSQIDDAFPVVPAVTYNSEVVTIDSKSFCNYNNAAAIQAKGSTGLLVAYANSGWSAEGVRNVIVNYRSNVFGSQYGGYTYEDRLNSKSIPCSGVIKSSEINTWVDVPYGDTFINYFDVSTMLADLTKPEYQNTWSETVYVPLESSINCDLRHDKEAAHMYTIPTSFPGYVPYLRQEYAGEHTMSIHSIERSFNQTEDLYLYNTVYSQQLDVKVAIPLPVDKTFEIDFDSMIKSSNTKSNGEITDSWTKFGINEFIEVDSINGPINALCNFNNRLMFFQDRGLGVVAVNERSLITDLNASQVVLGTGGVLDRFDYVSTHVGCKDKFSVTTSISGMYWYDKLSKAIYKYGNGMTHLTKVKNMQSYMDNTLDSTYKALSYADIHNDEVLFTFYKEGETNGFTLAFNEAVDAFVSFYDFVPIIYIPFKHRYLTTTNTYYSGNDVALNYIFLHNSNVWDRCYFYALATGDASKYVNSTLELLFNPDYEYTKVFDNLFYTSNTYTGTTDIFSDTFHYLQAYNDFQNTGEVPLVYKTNLERRERGWTTVVPRSIVNADVSTNPDKFTAVDSTQLFKERMRDKYLITYFTYVNDGTYDRFVVSNMGLKYRVSIR